MRLTVGGILDDPGRPTLSQSFAALLHRRAGVADLPPHGEYAASAKESDSRSRARAATLRACRAWRTRTGPTALRVRPPYGSDRLAGPTALPVGRALVGAEASDDANQPRPASGVAAWFRKTERP
jgi:hypothetical protein